MTDTHNINKAHEAAEVSSCDDFHLSPSNLNADNIPYSAEKETEDN
jgi:hypothetical protein